MTQADATDPVEATKPSRAPSVAELQRDIEQTRDELAATVAALAAKANLRARARERLSRPGMRGRVALAVVVGGAAIVGWLLMRRRRG